MTFKSHWFSYLPLTVLPHILFSCSSLSSRNANNPLCNFHPSSSSGTVFSPVPSSPHQTGTSSTNSQASVFSICFFFDNAGIVFLVEATSSPRIRRFCLTTSVSMGEKSGRTQQAAVTFQFYKTLVRESKMGSGQSVPAEQWQSDGQNRSLLTTLGFEPFKTRVVFRPVADATEVRVTTCVSPWL